MTYKLGSLFDGSGGFPLAGALCGIEPRWASEVEPYPIAVTTSRFPKVKHLGDISKINGGEIEPVDIITFGSPCQDLSVAGKRAGLKHEACGDDETTRSGLFMDAVRIIKEMRKATNGEYPRYALWENVPGAFSSNKGEDFRIVCEELIKVVEPLAVMPPVPERGWSYADSFVGDGWSLAYRVFDAQYWGVPQRRRRIHLVADFRGTSAREVLFEREGVRGYFTEGRTPWKVFAGYAPDGSAAADREGESLKPGADGDGGGLAELKAYGILRTIGGVDAYEEKSPTLCAAAGMSGNNKPSVAVPYTLKIRGGVETDSTGKGAGKGALVQTDKSATLGTSQDQYLFQPQAVLEPQVTGIIDNIGGRREYGYESEVNGTLCAGKQGAVFIGVPTIGLNGESEKAPTLIASGASAVGTTQDNLILCEPVVYDGAGITSPVNASNPKPGDPCHTLSTDGRNYVVENDPVYCLQGNGIDRADNAGCNGKGWKEDQSYTLNTIDRPAVVYALDRASFNQGENAKFDFEITDKGVNSPLLARGPGAVAYATDAGFFNTIENASPTLQARQYKDPPILHYGDGIHYIVRRLTPTECARLQGFADRWGEIDQKTDLTDEEAAFWREVYVTHQRIVNGKDASETGPKTKPQILHWYNKLHTDGAEYKMWGNGIALPPALYVLQGMSCVLAREENEWLN